MARAAKKETPLTTEEKLAKALVPEEEQPYPVPENWCWTTVKHVSYVVTGGTPSKKHPEYYGGTFPLFKPSDLDAGRNVYHATEYLSEEGKKVSRIIPAHSSLVCCIGSIGKCGFLMCDGTTNQQINAAIPKITPLYLYYYFQTQYFFNELWNKASATTISIVNKTKMENCKFPLPPLPEQQRIVTLIESLFADLDAAKEKLQSLMEGYAQRKIAILHRAFTGELTAKWREENEVGLESWKRYTAQEVCEKIVCGKTPKEYISTVGDIPYLKVYNIINNEIEFSTNCQFIPKIIHQSKLKSSILKPCDIIMNIVGPPLRKIAIVPENYREWNMNQAIVRFRAKEKLHYKFLYYELQNPQTLDSIIQDTRGVVGQANISVGQCRNLELKLPTLPEQKEIVRILDNVFAKESQSKAAVESALAKIDTMKKAILATAFRGGFETNNSSDESAKELLRKVL